MFTSAVGWRQHCTCNSHNSRSFLKRSIGSQGQTLRLSSTADSTSRSLHTKVPALKSSSASCCLAVRNIKSRGQNLRFSRSSLLSPTSARASFYILSTRSFLQKRSFSATSFAMTATKIDGTAIAKQIREKLRAEIAGIQKVNPRYRPSLKIIQGTA